MRLTAVTSTLLAIVYGADVRAVEFQEQPSLTFSDQAAFADAPDSLEETLALQSPWVEEVVPAEPSEDELQIEFDWAEADPLCGDGVDCGDGVCASDWLDPVPRHRQWIVLTELTLLVPSYSDSTFEAKHRPFVGPRLTLGWERANGFGIRGRGWGFDGATEAERSESFSSVTTHQLLFSGARLDLDFYKRIEHNTGDFTFGAGVTAAQLTLRERYTIVETSRININNYGYYYPNYFVIIDDSYYPSPLYGYPVSVPGLAQIQSSHSTYENGVMTTTYQGNGFVKNTGGGLGLMAEGTHRFYETPQHVWSLFGRGRVAYLAGKWETPPSSGRDDGDANMAIGEATLGVEYKRRCRYLDVSLSFAFEMQSWDVSIVDRVTLAGATTGLGVAW